MFRDDFFPTLAKAGWVEGWTLAAGILTWRTVQSRGMTARRDAIVGAETCDALFETLARGRSDGVLVSTIRACAITVPMSCGAWWRYA